MSDAMAALGVAALAVGAVALLIVAWRYPGVLFAAYLIVPPVFKAALQPHLPVDLTVVLAGLCALQVPLMLLDPGLRSRPPPMGGYVVWCLLAAFISVAVWWSPQPGTAMDRAASWLALGFLPLLAALRVTTSERHLVHFLRTLLVAGALVIAIGLPGVFGTERLLILGSDPIAATRAILLVPIIAVAFSSEHRWIRMAGLALYPFGLIVVVAIGSRGPLLAFGALSLVWLVSLARHRELARALLPIGLTVLGVVVIVGISAFLPAPSLDQFSGLARVAATGTGDESSGIRLELYRLAVGAFLAHPLVGLGTGGFIVIVAGTTYLYPHDVVLQFAAEFGIVGVSLLGAMLALFVVRRDLLGPPWTSVKAVFWFYLLCGVVSSDALGNRMVWGAMLLVLLAPAAARGAQARAAQARAAQARAAQARGAPAASGPRVGHVAGPEPMTDEASA